MELSDQSLGSGAPDRKIRTSRVHLSDFAAPNCRRGPVILATRAAIR